MEGTAGPAGAAREAERDPNGSGPRWAVTAGRGALAAALLWCAAGAGPLGALQQAAADGPGAAPRPSALPATPVADTLVEEAFAISEEPAGGPFRASDLAYAGTFLGALALVQPLRGLETALGRELETDAGGLAGSLASVGHVAGDLRVDAAVAAAAFLGGVLSGEDGLRRTGLRLLEGLAAADAMATLFKFGVGRQRPYATTESDTFDPLQARGEYASFPSGHAAHAFVLAATLVRELEGEAWAPWVAYPAAALIGASRVAGKKHWPTDVVAGATVGLFASRVVGRLHGEEGKPVPGPRPAVGALGGGGVWAGLSVPAF